MSSDAATPTATGEGASPSVRSVTFEPGGSTRGLPMILALQVLIGIVAGLAVYGIFVSFGHYVPIGTPMIIGLLLGAVAHQSIGKSGFDNFTAGVLCIFLGGVAAMGAFHVATYIDFLRQLDATVEATLQQRLDRNAREAGVTIDQLRTEHAERHPGTTYDEWVRDDIRENLLDTPEYFHLGNDSFLAFLALEGRRGVLTKRPDPDDPRDTGKGWRLGAAGAIAYRIAELLIIVAFGAWFIVNLLTTPRTRESRTRLPETQPMAFYPLEAARQVLDLVGKGEAASLARLDAATPGELPAVELAVVTIAGGTQLTDTGEPEVVLQVSRVTSTARGDLRHRDARRWWYPTGTVAELREALGTPPDMATAVRERKS